MKGYSKTRQSFANTIKIISVNLLKDTDVDAFREYAKQNNPDFKTIKIRVQ